MDLNNKYLEGTKYFMYFLSQNTIYPYIDTDLRKIIWNYVIAPPYMLCRAQDTILRLNLNINS
jgi:hypothetical protein